MKKAKAAKRTLRFEGAFQRLLTERGIIKNATATRAYFGKYEIKNLARYIYPVRRPCFGPKTKTLKSLFQNFKFFVFFFRFSVYRFVFFLFQGPVSKLYKFLKMSKGRHLLQLIRKTTDCCPMHSQSYNRLSNAPLRKEYAIEMACR